MTFILVGIFVLGYTAITLEHSLRIDKLIPALLMMVLSWTIIALNIHGISQWVDPHSGELLTGSVLSSIEKSSLLESTLLHHFGKTSEILIFLMGAMAIVELIDHFDGFGSIKSLIKQRKKLSLIWIISAIAFILSAIIDNLTATIVLITITRKIISDKETRMWFAGYIIIAANAGGAWTPIGDVTTTMLWMANKISTFEVMKLLILPSLICALIPLVAASFLPAFRGSIELDQADSNSTQKFSGFFLVSGLSLIVLVPIFKTTTHLPPYLGMMFSLSVMAILAEIFSKKNISFTQIEQADNFHDSKGPTLNALSKIEMPSVLFFLGILLTVSALEATGLIATFGQTVGATMDKQLFVTLLGVSSAIIDNVPLVAASIGMFTEGTDATIWHLVAYAAGTGGSMLIIGSAAGVVAMGMENISFFWYFKHISLLAFLGYIGGIASFLILNS
jgi:Na+/H+ antiporter NhaD/arsenite permease-like protein